MYIENIDNNSEFKIKEQLEKERKDIKTFDDLTLFLQRIRDNYNTGYDIAPRAIAQAILATGWYFSEEFGITGFQAGCVMWDFIKDWRVGDNKCGMKLVDYDDMLYPQCADRYEKTISSNTFKALQREARANLLNKEGAHPNVIKHWESIVEGNVPFGYEIED